MQQANIINIITNKYDPQQNPTDPLKNARLLTFVHSFQNNTYKIKEKLVRGHQKYKKCKIHREYQ